MRPAFDVIVFRESEPESTVAGRRPEVWEALFRTGVPRDLFSGRYTSAQKPVVLDVPEHGQLIQFGLTMRDPVCVDPTTGQVLEIIRKGGVLFVNSTLAAFTETVRAVLARFPYYDEDAEFDEIDAAARDLAGLIRGIDPEAMVPDRFWSTFVDDVEMGDFATQADEYQPGT